MAIPEILTKFKFHFIFATILSLGLTFLLSYSAGAFTILSYFWPLVLSTALFFAAVIVFGRISPPESDGSSEKTGTDLIDYVAAHPDPLLVEVHDTPLPQTDLQLPQTDLQ